VSPLLKNVALARTKSRDNQGCDCNGVILFNRNGLRKENFLAPAGIRQEKVRKARDVLPMIQRSGNSRFSTDGNFGFSIIVADLRN
jgi:hypothetical protein